jgi:hypothetical protein
LHFKAIKDLKVQKEFKVLKVLKEDREPVG